MKSVSMKMVIAVMLIAAGSYGVQAQARRGAGGRGMGTGVCYYAGSVTPEQQAQLLKMAGAHQADMVLLRDKMFNTTDPAARLAVRKEMSEKRITHWTAVEEIVPNRRFNTAPPAGGRGLGRGAGVGLGLGPCGGGGRFRR